MYQRKDHPRGTAGQASAQAENSKLIPSCCAVLQAGGREKNK